MKLEEIFGSLEAVDYISRRDGHADLVMIVNGYVGDSFDEQAALDRKLMYYIDYAGSEEFFAVYGRVETCITVSFTERPSDAIIDRLNVWHADMAGAPVSLAVTIAGLPMLFLD
ncbi:MAG: hypothetical protein IKP47_05610 [Ruminococcus sp.]|nr:hypothetical protein [Ruminococcus sp.]